MSSRDGDLLLAEGPVLDILAGEGSATPLRPATPLERLLGRAVAEPGVKR